MAKRRDRPVENPLLRDRVEATTTVKGSEVTPALWTLALRAEERIAEVSHKAPSMDRPSYGDRMARAEFEDAIAEFLQRVLR